MHCHLSASILKIIACFLAYCTGDKAKHSKILSGISQMNAASSVRCTVSTQLVPITSLHTSALSSRMFSGEQGGTVELTNSTVICLRSI